MYNFEFTPESRRKKKPDPTGGRTDGTASYNLQQNSRTAETRPEAGKLEVEKLGYGYGHAL